MKKIFIIFSIFLSASLFADISLGVRVNKATPNNTIHDTTQLKKHIYNKQRYRDFNYDRDAYYDDFGFYFGYFDRTGYYYNDVFFLYDGNYTYYDRLHRVRFFRPHHRHYRPHYKIKHHKPYYNHRRYHRPHFKEKRHHHKSKVHRIVREKYKHVDKKHKSHHKVVRKYDKKVLIDNKHNSMKHHHK